MSAHDLRSASSSSGWDIVCTSLLSGLCPSSPVIKSNTGTFFPPSPFPSTPLGTRTYIGISPPSPSPLAVCSITTSFIGTSHSAAPRMYTAFWSS